MRCKPSLLYHGTTIGWLHLSGFGRAEFAYGECADPSPFIYLCTTREGGESAACKAYNQVQVRCKNKPPSAHFSFRDTQYAIDRYVYEVKTKAEVEVLDFQAERLDAKDLARVKKAIKLAKKSTRCAALKTYFVLIALRMKPRTWRNQLETACGDRHERIVRVLSEAGFHMIKNFERDADGQQYGEVWVLPISKVSCVTLKQPVTYKLA